jgi:hypothetical protein
VESRCRACRARASFSIKLSRRPRKSWLLANGLEIKTIHSRQEPRLRHAHQLCIANQLVFFYLDCFIFSQIVKRDIFARESPEAFNLKSDTTTGSGAKASDPNCKPKELVESKESGNE